MACVCVTHAQSEAFSIADRIVAPSRRGSNVRKAGENLREGDELVVVTNGGISVGDEVQVYLV